MYLWIKNIVFLMSREILKNWSCVDHKENLTNIDKMLYRAHYLLIIKCIYKLITKCETLLNDTDGRCEKE